MRDHPDIAAALRTGYPLGHKDREIHCPVCGEELAIGIDEVYMSFGSCVGCCHCVIARTAGDTDE